MKDHGLKNNTKTVTHILAAASEIEGLFFNEKKRVIQAWTGTPPSPASPGLSRRMQLSYVSGLLESSDLWPNI